MNLTAQPVQASQDDLQTPPCPHFGPCRGCQLQHLTYSAQLEQKADALRNSLEAAGLTIPSIQRHCANPLGYRNRIRLTLGIVNNQLRAGYMRLPALVPGRQTAPADQALLDGPDPLESVLPPDGTDAPNLPPQIAQSSFLPITQCPIAAPILWNTAEAVVEYMNQHAAAWMERAPFTPDQLELFTTADESKLQMSLFVRTAAKELPKKFAAEFATLCESIQQQIPALAGAGLYLLPTRSPRGRRVEQPRPGPAWGSPGLNYTVDIQDRNGEPARYWVPRGAFFQVNRFLIPELLDVVTSARTGQIAWDLYAGVGLFSMRLTQIFPQVTAVEVAEPSFTALCSRHIPNLYAVKAATLQFLESAVLQRDRPDLIVLDPPRTGAGTEVCERVAQIGASTVVYVSCSPHTLPADLATLARSGYTVSELHLFDLFPQTAHVETVAVLQR